MARRLFVGGLSFDTSAAEVRKAFEAVGPVVAADVVMDRETGRSRGFGFVEMANDEDAATAVAQLNGTTLGGRTLTVNEASARSERGGGGRSGAGRGGGPGRGRGEREQRSRSVEGGRAGRIPGAGGYGGKNSW